MDVVSESFKLFGGAMGIILIVIVALLLFVVGVFQYAKYVTKLSKKKQIVVYTISAIVVIYLECLLIAYFNMKG